MTEPTWHEFDKYQKEAAATRKKAAQQSGFLSGIIVKLCDWIIRLGDKAKRDIADEHNEGWF